MNFSLLGRHYFLSRWLLCEWQYIAKQIALYAMFGAVAPEFILEISSKIINLVVPGFTTLFPTTEY